MEEKEKCVQCGNVITGIKYENYYCKHDYLCEEWDCWAEWMNDNTFEAEE